MNTKELQIVGELYNAIQRWKEKYSTEWLERSSDFKRFYQAVKHQQKIIELLTNSQLIPPLTIEEKVANAVFYVEDGIQYTIEYSNNMDREFHVFDGHGNERDIDYYSVPADAYFLATVRL